MGKEIGASFSGWNGLDNHLQVGATPTYKWRSCVYFNIDFTDMQSITSATLYLVDSAATIYHSEQDSPPSTLKVVRMTKDWGEGTYDTEGGLTANATWDWDNRYDAYTNTGNNTKSITQSAGSDTSISVTDIVTSWFNGSANYGFMLINDTSETNTNKAMVFYSKQKGGSDRPRLVINYTTNTAPSAPTLTSPVSASTVSTLSPSFTGDANDADAGDYIIAFQIQVYNNSTGALMWDSNARVVETFGTTSFAITYGYGSSSVAYQPLSSGVTYKWRARTMDRAGAWGAYSSYSTFTTNTQPNEPTITINPPTLSDVTDSTPDITVLHNDPDASDYLMHGYEVIVEALSGSVWSQVWTSGVVSTAGAPVASVTVSPSTLSWATQHRVTARTKDSSLVWSNYAQYVTFTTHTTYAPTSLSPTADEAVSSSPYFSGFRYSSSDVITSYEIMVYSDDLVSTLWSSGTLTSGITSGSLFNKQYAGSALSAGSYYQWKARVTSSIGGTSDWSGLQRFSVVAATVPSLSTPVTTGITDLTPTLTGSRASSFNRFKLELYPSTATTSVLGTALWTSGTLSATIGAGGLGTQFTYDYPGSPALSSGTTYKWRAAVSSDAGSTWSSWSGLASFTTAYADTPTLTSAGGTSYPTYPWVTDSTPDFVVTRGASTNLSKTNIIVYNESATATVWDSGMIDHANGTTSTTTYAGSTLVPGTTYLWQAKIEDVNGLVSDWTAMKAFRLNSPPTSPSTLYPSPGYVLQDSLLPLFKASYDDPDTAGFGDYPTYWEIVVTNSSGTTIATITRSTSLTNGLNSYQTIGADLTLSYNTLYYWKTRFKDSKAEWGTYSGLQSFTCVQSPNGTITSPSAGNISSSSPTINWSYTGATQYGFNIAIDETDSSYNKVSDVWESDVISATASYTIPSGHLENTKYYTITLTVKDTNLIEDPTPSTVNVRLMQDAPDAIVDVQATVYEELSKVVVSWAQTSLKLGHTFVSYNIYRRVVGDITWTLIGTTGTIGSTSHTDWYAGHGVSYDYRVTVTTTVTGVSIESPDATSPDSSIAWRIAFDTDVWMFIGVDRSQAHIQELPVMDESHSRPVQQESFEVLGSNRKVIVRGYVLGHEGSITCIWDKREVESPTDEQVLYDYTIIGRRLVDYLTNVRGPHILKSPFGDVWDVEFASPSFQWQGGGHLQVTLEWVETGQTSQGGVV